jgi:DNA-binding NtrC family response regulator
MRAFILVIEQDLLVRETIIYQLAALGHRAIGSPSIFRGLKLLKMIEFDVMIISPSATSNGEPSYALEAKKIQPHVKVLMAAAMYLPEFSELSIDAFIQKPFSALTLEVTLKRIYPGLPD